MCNLPTGIHQFILQDKLLFSCEKTAATSRFSACCGTGCANYPPNPGYDTRLLNNQSLVEVKLFICRREATSFLQSAEKKTLLTQHLPKKCCLQKETRLAVIQTNERFPFKLQTHFRRMLEQRLNATGFCAWESGSHVCCGNPPQQKTQIQHRWCFILDF